MRWTEPRDEWTAATENNETGERWVYFFDDLEELRLCLLAQIADETIPEDAALDVLEKAEDAVKSDRMEELLHQMRNIPLGEYLYLATAYSRFPGGTNAANSEACQAAAYLIENGIRVFSPIAHSHAICVDSGLDPLDHNLWLTADAPFMEHAYGLVVVLMDGWSESKGVRHEIEQFKGMQKPIYFLPWSGGDE